MGIHTYTQIYRCVCVCVCVKMKVMVGCVRLFAAFQALLCPWNSPGKNTGVGSHSLLQRIFLTQGSNLGLLHCRQILYSLSHQGSPCLCVCVCVCVCVHWKHIRGFVKWTPSPGINLVASTKDEDLLANCTVKLLGCPSRWLLQGQQNTYYSPGAKSQGRSEDLRHHCCL